MISVPDNLTPLEFIKYVSKYIPTSSRLDAGVDFNLHQVHTMINEYLEDYKNEN